ncbi:hypothetical protein ZWY2020_028604 [Hordeum vulgare]|nr:hypothetical protein ZWY2020_028604 [Hordeum vulgare]
MPRVDARGEPMPPVDDQEKDMSELQAVTWYYEKWRVHELDSTISYASSDKKRKKNKTPSESTNDSKDTKNTKGKNHASDIKDTDTGALRLETDLEKFRQIYVAEIINTSDLDKQLVVIDDIVLLQKHLQCLTVTDGGKYDKWLGDEVVDAVIEIMCHDHPKDTRDGQLVYIERVADVAMLERDGKVENCHEAALAGSHGTPKGDNYLKHDLTWYYEKWRVHQLDSTISYASRLRPLIQNWSEEKAKKVDNIIENNYLGVGEYVEDLMRPFIPAQDGTLAKLKTGTQVVDAAIELMRHDEPTDTRDDQLVYIERVADVVKHERDGRIEKCYEDALAGISGTTQGTSYLKHDMANIDEFRRELPVVLVDSPYNKMKYMKRFKQYHARLSDAAAVEGDEDASS